MNNLQDIFAKAKIPMALDLPRIAVVGAQSSGKSSVLEFIMSRDILPRGTGMVTRCPIILQLQRILEGDDYVKFTHKPDVEYKDFDLAREEIIAETNRLTGNKRNVTETPIVVKLFAKNVLNLTLVDLPGLIKNVDADQPKEVVKDIEKMVQHEIKGENCIILAVSAGNTDMANSDALNLARKVDPEGNRTVGVITKLDIMDKGVDVLDILTGQIYPLKLGYIGVVCRSALAIKEKKSIPAAVKDEELFFKKHEVYGSISVRCGTRYLAKKLSDLLLDHIRSTIPALRKAAEDTLLKAKKELESYGIEQQGGLHSTLTSIIGLYSNYYNEIFDEIDMRENELSKGARIHHILHNAFAGELKKIHVFHELDDERIRTVISNSKALKVCLFLPDDAFNLLIGKQLQALLNPCMKCLKIVNDEIIQLASMPNIPQLKEYSVLRKRIGDIMKNYLDLKMKEVGSDIKKMIEAEYLYISSEDPGLPQFEEIIYEILADEINKAVKEMLVPKNGYQLTANECEELIKKATALVLIKKKELSPSMWENVKPRETTGLDFGAGPALSMKTSFVPRQVQAEEVKSKKLPDPIHPDLSSPLPKVMKVDFLPSKAEEIKLKAMKKLLELYFESVKCKLIDIIPKFIVVHFIDATKTNVRIELSNVLYEVSDIKALMSSDPEVGRKRTSCKALIDALEECLKVLNEVVYTE